LCQVSLMHATMQPLAGKHRKINQKPFTGKNFLREFRCLLCIQRNYDFP
jgi:hypothetical protein